MPLYRGLSAATLAVGLALAWTAPSAAPTFRTVVRGARPKAQPGQLSLTLDDPLRAPPGGGSTGSDLLRLLPGMHVVQHSGEGKAAQLFLRGFDAVHLAGQGLGDERLRVSTLALLFGPGFS